MLGFSLGPKHFCIWPISEESVCVHMCWEIVLWEEMYLHISYFPEIIALIHSPSNPREARIDGIFSSKEGICY